MDSRFAEQDWESVDESPAPEQYVEFLESVSDTEWAQRAKEASYRALRASDGDTVLDLGCGVGTDVVGLAEYVGESGTVVGVDNSESMIEAAKENYGGRENVQFVVDDANDLSLSSDRFDRSRTERVLQHVSQPVDAIRELKRVTRPGGLVMATEPDWSTYVLDVPDSEIADDLMEPRYAPVKHPTIGQQLYRQFSEAGFADVEVNSYSLTLDRAEPAILTFRLKQRLKAMINEGQIEPEDADRWLEDLARASENGRFVAAGTAFSVVGRVE